MNEPVEFFIHQNELSIRFQSIAAKTFFLDKMKTNGIDFFEDTPDSVCLIRQYQHSNPSGQFISEHNRMGLVFPSEALKFFFKESIALNSDYFMDMGPGYDAQLHFNTAFLPCKEHASITTQMILSDEND